MTAPPIGVSTARRPLLEPEAESPPSSVLMVALEVVPVLEVGLMFVQDASREDSCPDEEVHK